MLALTEGWSQFIILAAAGVIGALVLGIGRSVMGLVRTRQTKTRQDETDQRVLTEFLFGTQRDPRTGTPAKEGWTTRVDRALSELAKDVTEVLNEIRPDHNGRHNLRGIVERGAEAAGADLPPECKSDER